MDKFSKNVIHATVATANGVFGSFLWGQAEPFLKTLATPYPFDWDIFYVTYYSLTGLIIALFGGFPPWVWVGFMMVSHYFAGYFFIEHWGQFGPFDLAFMLYYTLPCLAAAYAGTCVKKLLSRRSTARQLV